MFEKLKAVAGVASMLKDIPGIKAKLLETREELGRLQCIGHSECRRVRAVVNGRLQMVSIDIDPALAAASTSPKGRAELQEAVVQASNDALAHARREAAQRLGDVAREIGIPLPQSLLQHLQ